MRIAFGNKELMPFWVMVAPAVVGFVLFVVGPMLFSLYLSFTKYDIIHPPQFTGLSNYHYLLTEEPSFWTSLKVTLIYTLSYVPLNLAVSLAIAILLNQKVRGIGLYRTLYFLPYLLPATASGVIWVLIFNPGFGVEYPAPDDSRSICQQKIGQKIECSI